MKITSSTLGRTCWVQNFFFDIQNNFCTQHVLLMLWTSEKDITVCIWKFSQSHFITYQVQCKYLEKENCGTLHPTLPSNPNKTSWGSKSWVSPTITWVAKAMKSNPKVFETNGKDLDTRGQFSLISGLCHPGISFWHIFLLKKVRI